jgi:hypothetical protein
LELCSDGGGGGRSRFDCPWLTSLPLKTGTNSIFKNKYYMKILFLISLFCIACSSEPKTPIVCQQNVQFCLSSWKDHTAHPHEEWNQLCMDDLKECKSNWGMQ